MAEYIDREEYCEKHCRCSNEYCGKERCPIWKAPAADVVPVDEYIKREAVKGLININFSGLLAAIDLIPAADVAPVVRCKDCAYSYEDIGGRTCSHGVCVDCIVPDDFCCAYGKREENNNEAGN